MESTSKLPDQAVMEAAWAAEAAAIPGMKAQQAKTGEIAFDFANSDVLLAWLASQDIEYRYNIRQEQHEIKRTDTWSEWTPGHQAFTREQIEKNYFLRRGEKRMPLSFSDPKFRNSLESLSEIIRYDPFKEWLLSLPNFPDMPEAMRVPRARMLLHDMLGADDTELNRFASVYTFGVAVSRAFLPGAKFDAMVLLIGKQGCGKSSFYELAFPEEHRETWFTDALRWDATIKEQVETVLGAVIVESAENVGFRKADNERTKAMLSRRRDKVRLAYRANTGTFKRRCAIVSTTNNPDAVPFDPSGSRRHIPVVCRPGAGMTRDAMEEYWDIYREAIWAEVLHLFRNQYRFALMGKMERTAMAMAERHMDANEVLEDAVTFLATETHKEGARLIDLMGEMGLMPHNGGQPSMKDQKEAGAALRRGGWEKRPVKRDGRTVKWWFPPQ